MAKKYILTLITFLSLSCNLPADDLTIVKTGVNQPTSVVPLIKINVEKKGAEINSVIVDGNHKLIVELEKRLVSYEKKLDQLNKESISQLKMIKKLNNSQDNGYLETFAMFSSIFLTGAGALVTVIALVLAFIAFFGPSKIQKIVGEIAENKATQKTEEMATNALREIETKTTEKTDEMLKEANDMVADIVSEAEKTVSEVVVKELIKLVEENHFDQVINKAVEQKVSEKMYLGIIKNNENIVDSVQISEELNDENSELFVSEGGI